MADLDNVIKKTIERQFPTMGDGLIFGRPFSYAQVQTPAGDRGDVDQSRVNDGGDRQYFRLGISDWAGDDIVAE